jgi:hypothetical protein
MPDLTLHIETVPQQLGWQATWSLDGAPVGAAIPVTDSAAQAVRHIGGQFLELFERGGRPLVDLEELRSTGRALFEQWFQPAWQSIEPRLGNGPHQLVIRSADRDVLNTPFELVELSEGLPIGCDAAWSLRRTPLNRLDSEDGKLEPGPLRILFLAAAPTDQPQLDYEREEDAMLRATARLKDDVVVHFSETGSFEELAELVAQLRPHIVHLSGHGRVNRDGSGTFAFEDERGRTDSKDAEEIVATVFRGSPVRCVFFNGCQTSQAAAAGLCQALVTAGVPMAIGWSASVADDLATEFAETFYRRLVRGESVPAATAHSREAIRRRGMIRHGQVQLQDATFALPQIYCSTDGTALFDLSAPKLPYVGPRTEYELLGDGIKGLREGYVGRRREGQRLVPALRDGDISVVVITGLGGAGKSTLATRAANRLRGAGFHVRPVRAAHGAGPAESARGTLDKLISTLDDAFVKEGREDLHHHLTDGKLPLKQRLRLAADGLNELRLAVVLDNLEDCLELETRRIADPELAEFYGHLTAKVTRGSRVIVTCRYLPADTSIDQPSVVHLPLPDLEEHNFLKFLRRDPIVDGRIRREELPARLLTDLYRKLGGTPGFLANVRLVLRSADADELAEDLSGETPGALSDQRDRYYQQICATRLYDALSPEARDLASRLAVSELPLPIDAIVKSPRPRKEFHPTELHNTWRSACPSDCCKSSRSLPYQLCIIRRVYCVLG